MRVVHGIENYHEDHSIYLALGNFDGVHRGHQQLIGATVEKAHQEGELAAAFIFEPHPAQILFPEKAPKMLVNIDAKTRLLEECGIDLLVYSPFTMQIAAWTPEEFVNTILVRKLHVKEVFVGFNYSFGYRGLGTPENLEQLGRQQDFKVNVISPVTIGGELVSSSLVRSFLEQGDVKKAAKMLGYLPFVEGEVIHGEHRGSTIGFPTANVGIEACYIIPGKGVYAAQAMVEGDPKNYQCVINIGSKPTFHEAFPISIEAHIIDFQQDIYGKRISLHFIDKLRDEKKFASLEGLLEQITKDRQIALGMLNAYDSFESGN